MALNDSCDACEKAIAKASKVQDIPMLQQAIESVKESMILPMTKTDKSLPTEGCRETKDFIFSIQRDYFVSSPAVHADVRMQVEKIERMISKAQLIILTAEKKIDFVMSCENTLGDYCEAIFVGAISFEGRVITYNRYSNGVKDTITLSKRGEEYPFSSIPLYQGFLNYQKWNHEMKSEVKKIAESRLVDNADGINTAAKTLKEYLSEERLVAFSQLSHLYKEENEIVEFLSAFKHKINDLCMEFGI